MSQPLRIAVIGSGRLGTFHAQKINKISAEKNLDFVGIIDPSDKQRAIACQSLQCAGYAELTGSLLDSLDAAVVAAPTPLHHNIGQTLLSHGIHTLMEKPVTVTTAEADELVKTAYLKGLTFQVGHVERFNPAFEEARSLIGRPRYIHAVRSSNFTFRSTDVGVVLDLMIHDIDLVLSLVKSPITRVEAQGKALVSGHEDVAQARLYFENGSVADLEASRLSRKPIRSMTVWSADRWTEIDFATRSYASVHPDEGLLNGEFDVNELDTQQLDYFKQNLMEEKLPQVHESFAAVDALELEERDFVDSIYQARSPRVNGKDGRDAVYAAEQILKSIADNEERQNRIQPLPGILKFSDFRKVV